MKVFTKAEFLKLPAGVLFSNYEPCVFNGLYIKGDSLGSSDFYEEQLIGNLQDYNVVKYDDKEFVLEFGVEGREGLFEDDALYAVYEEYEINNLLAHIRNNCRGL